MKDLLAYPHVFQCYNYLAQQEDIHWESSFFIQIGDHLFSLPVSPNSEHSPYSLQLFVALLQTAKEIYNPDQTPDRNRVKAETEKKFKNFLDRRYLSAKTLRQSHVFFLFPDSKNEQEDHNKAFEGEKEMHQELYEELGYKKNQIHDFSSDVNNTNFDHFLQEIKKKFVEAVVIPIQKGQTPWKITIEIGQHWWSEGTMVIAKKRWGKITQKQVETLYDIATTYWEQYAPYYEVKLSACYWERQGIAKNPDYLGVKDLDAKNHLGVAAENTEILSAKSSKFEHPNLKNNIATKTNKSFFAESKQKGPTSMEERLLRRWLNTTLSIRTLEFIKASSTNPQSQEGWKYIKLSQNEQKRQNNRRERHHDTSANRYIA